MALPADPLHDPLGQSSLQQLDQRIDRARAVVANGFPAVGSFRTEGLTTQNRDLPMTQFEQVTQCQSCHTIGPSQGTASRPEIAASVRIKRMLPM